jgi:hypothetical protein
MPVSTEHGDWENPFKLFSDQLSQFHRNFQSIRELSPEISQEGLMLNKDMWESLCFNSLLLLQMSPPAEWAFRSFWMNNGYSSEFDGMNSNSRNRTEFLNTFAGHVQNIFQAVSGHAQAQKLLTLRNSILTFLSSSPSTKTSSGLWNVHSQNVPLEIRIDFPLSEYIKQAGITNPEVWDDL